MPKSPKSSKSSTSKSTRKRQWNHLKCQLNELGVSFFKTKNDEAVDVAYSEMGYQMNKDDFDTDAFVLVMPDRKSPSGIASIKHDLPLKVRRKALGVLREFFGESLTWSGPGKAIMVY